MSKIGIQNTKEVLDLSKFVTLYLIREIKKDGFKVSDVVTMVKSQEFLAKFMPAVEDAIRIKDEVKDIDFMEGYELAHASYVLGKEIINELRKSS